MIKAVIYTL